mmetsp:Transcript_10132/g.30984  ORF Transcript_10132/g.30984 Transcript_10132/m.30984 type:complete len:85 (+) Transcript_10132:421-675(+)
MSFYEVQMNFLNKTLYVCSDGICCKLRLFAVEKKASRLQASQPDAFQSLQRRSTAGHRGSKVPWLTAIPPYQSHQLMGGCWCHS